MTKKGSSGRHGGGHKVRQRGANASDRKQAEREKQARIAKERAADKKKPQTALTGQRYRDTLILRSPRSTGKRWRGFPPRTERK